MSEQNTITIKINGQSLTCQPGQNIIDVADQNGIYIPRFCYHKNLSVVANCRMCLVEVEKAPKPLPACATSVMDGMVVKTNSEIARRAQKGVMEFLLINHPLDCPICDQGGECELQDLSMGFGESVSRFTEGKRAVADEDLGPLIATNMTRCIHCTRCVRFGTEIAGESEMGACGRGGHMEIGTYLSKGVRSELSGNMIDLCPVGALTSKPFAYRDRSWRFDQHHGVSPHDCVGSNLYIHTVNRNIGKKSEVMRVLPKENTAINQTWISDRDRFSYTALSSNRVTEPMIKKNGTWEAISWQDALTHLHAVFDSVIEKNPLDAAMLLSPNTSCEEGYLAQKWWRSSGAVNVDHRLRWADNRDDQGYPKNPASSVSLEDISAAKSIYLIGAQTREHQPLLNLRIRQAALKGARVQSLHAHQTSFNFPLHQHTAHPSDWAAVLLGYARARQVKLDALWQDIPSQEGLDVHEDESIWILGDQIAAHPNASMIRSLVHQIAQELGHRVVMLSDGANSTGLWLSGAVGHRQAGGEVLSKPAEAVSDYFTNPKSFYWLHQVQPEFDSLNPSQALKALHAAFVVSVSSHWSPALGQYADIILPTAAFTEYSGTTINFAGQAQSYRAAKYPPGGARPGWKIYRLLGNLANFEGFDFESHEAVWDMLNSMRENQGSRHYTYRASALDKREGGVVRLGYPGAMSVDSLVRGAEPLQKSQGNAPIMFSAKTASMFGLNENVATVLASQGGAKVRYDVQLTDAVSDGCVVLPGATEDAQLLGNLVGPIVLESADV